MIDKNVIMDNFFSLSNPLFLGIILFIFLTLLSLLFFFLIYYPNKQKLLLENAQLMALFAELDPDPLLRINYEGIVIQTNEASRRIFTQTYGKKIPVKELIPELNVGGIAFDEQKVYLINERFYNITVRSVESAKFSNIYLHDITELVEYERQLELYKNNLALLSQSLEKQNEELKKQLSAELHDDLGQRMILLKLKISQREKYNEDEIREDLEYISGRVREISHNLAPIKLDNLGLVFTIQRIINNISNAGGIEGKFIFDEDEDDIEVNLDNEIKECLLHCVQEGVNNIIKHSQADSFNIELSTNNGSVSLVIADNGKGFEENFEKIKFSEKSGIGLFRMSERIRSLNGQFSISSDNRFSTKINVPLPKGISNE